MTDSRSPTLRLSNPIHHAEPRLGGDSVDGVVGTPNQKGEI